MQTVYVVDDYVSSTVLYNAKVRRCVTLCTISSLERPHRQLFTGADTDSLHCAADASTVSLLNSAASIPDWRLSRSLCSV
jgi:hypothetical protein